MQSRRFVPRAVPYMMKRGSPKTHSNQVKKMKDEGKPKQKNLNVELLRLLSCFLVIMAHVKPFYIMNGEIMDGALLIGCLITPAVGCFFMISGFFLSEKTSSKKALTNFMKRVAWPAFLLFLANIFLKEWLAGPASRAGREVTIVESALMAQPLEDLKQLLFGIIAFDAGIFGHYLEHLWYVFSHLVIIIWMPVITALIRGKGERAMLLLCVIYLWVLLIIDLNNLFPTPFRLYQPQTAALQATYCMAGYLLYKYLKPFLPAGFAADGHENKAIGTVQNKYPEWIKKTTICIGFFILFFVIITILFLSQRELFSRMLAAGADPESMMRDGYFFSWLSGLGFLSALALSSFILSLPLGWIRGRFRNALLWLSGTTYPVFLLHYFLVQKLRVLNIEARAQLRLHAYTAPGAIIYTVLYASAVFLASAFLTAVIRFVSKLPKSLH